jgi:hypothetical protein
MRPPDLVPGYNKDSLRIAVLFWTPGDGICAMLCDELARLQHTPLPFQYGSPVPRDADVLFSFGPYGQLLPVWETNAQTPSHLRPTTVHWNTEGMPDLRIPGRLASLISRQISRLTHFSDSRREPARAGAGARGLAARLVALLKRRTARFRYAGDYDLAVRRGWLQVLADTSAVYTARRSRLGTPTMYAPWGSTPTWYADMQLDRDIDVLWMGKRGSPRRSHYLDRVRSELAAHSVNVYVADNVERPFIFGNERTTFLNRSKITLNLTRTWYDDNFSRFALAAPNRSMVASEPLLAHCPEYQAGVHYVSAPIEELADTIVYYLRNEDHRRQIAERAYELTTTTLAFRHSLQRMLEQASLQRGQCGASQHPAVGAPATGQA